VENTTAMGCNARKTNNNIYILLPVCAVSNTAVKRIPPYPFRNSTLNKHHGKSDWLVQHAQYAGESIAQLLAITRPNFLRRRERKIW
jgi:hypothetical protein